MRAICSGSNIYIYRLMSWKFWVDLLDHLEFLCLDVTKTNSCKVKCQKTLTVKTERCTVDPQARNAVSPQEPGTLFYLTFLFPSVTLLLSLLTADIFAFLLHIFTPLLFWSIRPSPQKWPIHFLSYPKSYPWDFDCLTSACARNIAWQYVGGIWGNVRNCYARLNLNLWGLELHYHYF